MVVPIVVALVVVAVAAVAIALSLSPTSSPPLPTRYKEAGGDFTDDWIGDDVTSTASEAGWFNVQAEGGGSSDNGNKLMDEFSGECNCDCYQKAECDGWSTQLVVAAVFMCLSAALVALDGFLKLDYKIEKMVDVATELTHIGWEYVRAPPPPSSRPPAAPDARTTTIISLSGCRPAVTPATVVAPSSSSLIDPSPPPPKPNPNRPQVRVALWRFQAVRHASGRFQQVCRQGVWGGGGGWGVCVWVEPGRGGAVRAKMVCGGCLSVTATAVRSFRSRSQVDISIDKIPAAWLPDETIYEEVRWGMPSHLNASRHARAHTHGRDDTRPSLTPPPSGLPPPQETYEDEEMY